MLCAALRINLNVQALVAIESQKKKGTISLSDLARMNHWKTLFVDKILRKVNWLCASSYNISDNTLKSFVFNTEVEGR